MSELKRRYGSWALVAGAAEGLGEAYSRELAGRGMNLIMVDNQEGKMEKLSADLRTMHETDSIRIAGDLSEEQILKKMTDAIREKECRLVIYNAAYSQVQRFTENSEADLENYVRINMSTPIRLVRAFTLIHADRPFEKKGIILMSSLAGIWGARYLAPYGATKAFNRVLAEGLHHELAPLGFDVMACIAGATATPAYLGTNPKYGFIRPHVMQPSEVTRVALDKLGRRAVYIPGFNNRLTAFLLGRVLPRSVSSRMFDRTVEKMYGKDQPQK